MNGKCWTCHRLYGSPLKLACPLHNSGVTQFSWPICFAWGRVTPSAQTDSFEFTACSSCFPIQRPLTYGPVCFTTLHHPTHYYLLLSFHQAGDTEERVYSETVPTPPKPSGISICISTLNNFCTCWTSALCCIISSGYKAPCLLLYCQSYIVKPRAKILLLVPKGVK